MARTTTTEQIRQQVALMLDRDDAHQQDNLVGSGSTDFLNIFIADAEKRIYRDILAYLPPFEFRQEHTLASGEDSFNEPLGYLGVRYVEAEVNGVRRLLVRTSVENIRNANIQDRIDVPDEFAYGSNVFYFRPSNSEVKITIYYYGELTSVLNIPNEDTNHYLLNNFDDILRYYAAIEGAMYYNTDALKPMIGVWEEAAKKKRDAVIMQDNRARQSGSTGRMGRFYRKPPRISPNIGAFGR